LLTLSNEEKKVIYEE